MTVVAYSYSQSQPVCSVTVFNGYAYTPAQIGMYRGINAFDRFRELKELWLNEVGLHSNPDILFNNENYKAIIDMGSEVIPYLIQDLQNGDGDWFNALAQITNTDPISEDHRGDYDAMTNDWVQWFEENS